MEAEMARGVATSVLDCCYKIVLQMKLRKLTEVRFRGPVKDAYANNFKAYQCLHICTGQVIMHAYFNESTIRQYTRL